MSDISKSVETLINGIRNEAKKEENSIVRKADEYNEGRLSSLREKILSESAQRTERELAELKSSANREFPPDVKAVSNRLRKIPQTAFLKERESWLRNLQRAQDILNFSVRTQRKSAKSSAAAVPLC